MLRATEILRAGLWNAKPAGVVRLDYDHRTRRRITLTAAGGLEFLLDLAKAPVLAYLQAFAANLVSAGVRLIPLGQTDGLRVLARLEPLIPPLAARALGCRLDDVGGAGVVADIASMRHETQYTRLFRS